MMSLLELIRELQMTKGIFKDPRGIHMAVKDSLDSSHNNNKKNTF